MRPATAVSSRPILGTLAAVALAAVSLVAGDEPARAAEPMRVVAADAPAEGGSVEVGGSGFDGAATEGIYLGVGPTGLPGFYQGSDSLLLSETVWIAPGNSAGSGPTGRTATMAPDGRFRVTVTVPSPSESVPEYAIYTSKAHGLGVRDQSQDTITGISFARPSEPAPPVDLGPDEPDHESDATDPAAPDPGSSEPAVPAPAVPSPDVAGAPAQEPAAVTFAAPAQAEAASTAAPCIARAVAGGTLTWGVKSSFRNYISGAIAKGSWTTTAGVAFADGAFRWADGTGAYSSDTGRGTVSFSGGASFSGHDGALDLAVRNPRIRFDSATRATLLVDARSSDAAGATTSGSGIAFASLALPAMAVGSNALAGDAVPATLTEAGARAFAGFYDAGVALDPVSFRLPLGASAPCASSTRGTLASTTTGTLASTGGIVDSSIATAASALIAGGSLLFAVNRRHSIRRRAARQRGSGAVDASAIR